MRHLVVDKTCKGLILLQYVYRAHHQWTKGQRHRPRGHLVHPGHRQRVQHHHQAVQIVPNGMLVYPLQGGAGHAEQEAGDLLKLPAQSKADLESKRSCGRLELLLLWKFSHLYLFVPFLFEA